ncbi:unnamed protein product [Urochloa humidicola]
MASPSGYEPLLPQALTPVPSPVVVVSPQFCAKEVVPLTVTKKVMSLSGSEYSVTHLVFWIIAAGEEMIQSSQCVTLYSLPTPTDDQEGTQYAQQMGSVQRGQLEVKRFALHCESIDAPAAEDRAGCLLGWEHRRTGLRLQDEGQLLRQGLRLLPRRLKHIAQISRKYTAANVLLGKDTFNITVFPDVDHVFVAALVVVLDEVHTRDRNYG